MVDFDIQVHTYDIYVNYKCDENIAVMLKDNHKPISKHTYITKMTLSLFLLLLLLYAQLQHLIHESWP